MPSTIHVRTLQSLLGLCHLAIAAWGMSRSQSPSLLVISIAIFGSAYLKSKPLPDMIAPIGAMAGHVLAALAVLLLLCFTGPDVAAIVGCYIGGMRLKAGGVGVRM
ncbi:hypothetical protein BH09PSE4_BH09PSE4_02970 [soil metagenome]